jgi:putative FmdB family regulatory protein
MPIYEYRCRGCGKDFEKYVPGVSTKVACPVCAGSDITRKLSVFGLGAGSNPSPVASSMAGGGGCCGGGGCGCH